MLCFYYPTYLFISFFLRMPSTLRTTNWHDHVLYNRMSILCVDAKQGSTSDITVMAYNSFFANPPANSSNVNPNGGGHFGLAQNTNTTQNNTTPSPFGNTNPTPNPLQPQPTQPSLFGNPNTNAGINTNTNQNTTTNTGGSLFGQQSQQPSMGGSIFGSTNNPTSISTGGGGQQQPLSSMFSSLNPRPNPTTGVGTGITGQQQLAEAQEQYIKITRAVETVYNAWNPSSKDCRFQVGFCPPFLFRFN